ncbi:hypothetical protein GCM10027589_39670 [Actinocorallia lasiicapitis]
MRILVVDDDQDVHQVTDLVLKGLRFGDRKAELLHANNGAEALAMVADHEDLAVILLDVVMENDHAGLDACRKIRTELHRPHVRVLLRTGQPGLAPEERVVQDYDIDGYLAKDELTASRLRTAVRTAVKAYEEITSLERRRVDLETLHESVQELGGPTDWTALAADDGGWPR